MPYKALCGLPNPHKVRRPQQELATTMDMTGERRIAAPRQKVWDALNDLAILRACIPGCESLEKEGDADLRATAAIKIGPIAARFTGKVKLSDLDPPNSYRISGEGQGGVAGFAKGGANVRLAEDGPDTLLTYDVKAQVGGKIAQLGARLIDATSKQMADMFFDRFSKMVAASNTQAAPISDVLASDVLASDILASGALASGAPASTAPASTAPAASTPTGPYLTSAASTPAYLVTAAIAADMADPTTVPGATPAVNPNLVPPPPPNAPAAISIFSLIPSQIFGLPLVGVVGTAIWVVIAFLIFKSYLPFKL